MYFCVYFTHLYNKVISISYKKRSFFSYSFIQEILNWEHICQALFKMLRIKSKQIPNTGGAYVYVKMFSFMCPYIQVYGIPFLCPHTVSFICAYRLYSIRSGSYCWIHTALPMFCYFKQCINCCCSVAKSCQTLYDFMNDSMPGFHSF